MSFNLNVKYSLVLGFILFMFWAEAQDFNFSQFTPNRNFYNPAFTGMEKGVFRSTVIYRRLWPEFPGEFSTKHLSVDYKAHSTYGLGFYAISNREGEGFLKTHTFGASYSWQGKISDFSGSFFQLGISASYNQKQIDFKAYTFSDELHEIYGKIFSTSFVPERNRQHYIDFAIGGLMQFPTIRGNHKIMIHTIGMALHHFTRPNDSFFKTDARLPMKITIHGQSILNTKVYSVDKEKRLRLIPSVIYQVQGDKLFSSSARNNFLCGVDVEADPLFGGIWYSSQILNNSQKNYRALILQFGLKLLSYDKRILYRIGYSYDMTIAKFADNTQKAHEISLSIDFLFKSRYKYNILSF